MKTFALVLNFRSKSILLFPCLLATKCKAFNFARRGQNKTISYNNQLIPVKPVSSLTKRMFYSWIRDDSFWILYKIKASPNKYHSCSAITASIAEINISCFCLRRFYVIQEEDLYQWPTALSFGNSMS